ncbi:thiol-disulfide oxidoreductase resA [Candidatus Moduliflexus flocculans]|uniref:Thiol-disulfide oxidoreductase resA n=1 Tax=Candidatus Moduliflexus flocculans TaxID=1499966 RepID=A0A0S6W329_9BACT|nr:thiol-disulfide oxidoreductase resA [Candidatus Moduliflexus flocculans]
MAFSKRFGQKLLPFFMIAVAVIFVMEGRKKLPLPAPDIQFIPVEQRSAEGTEFTLPSLHDNAIKLVDLRGNVVLLNFFATWCPPCREEMPTIQALFETYQHQGFVVLGVASDAEGKKIVEPFVKEYKMTFPVALDSDSRVSQQYLVRSIPTIYLFDRHGRIAARVMSAGNWNSQQAKDAIEQLLREP